MRRILSVTASEPINIGLTGRAYVTARRKKPQVESENGVKLVVAQFFLSKVKCLYER
jgi:hypothetical protein